MVDARLVQKRTPGSNVAIDRMSVSCDAVISFELILTSRSLTAK